MTQRYKKVMKDKRVLREDAEADKCQGNHVNGIRNFVEKMSNVCSSAYNNMFDPLFYVCFLLQTDHTSWMFTLLTCINTYIHIIVHT